MAEKRAETGYPGLGDARRGRHGVAIVVVSFVVEGQRNGYQLTRLGQGIALGSGVV
jgi:hypothetical protein